MNTKLRLRTTNQHGASLLEYCFLATLIFLACISAVYFIGQETTVSYSKIGSTLQKN